MQTTYIYKLTRLFSLCAAFFMTFTATSVLYAKGHCGSQETVFYCKTTKEKQVKVCKSGSNYTYQYGRRNTKPELTLKRDMKVDMVYYIPWNGVGNDITQTIVFENGKTIYALYSTNKRMGIGQTNGGVLVQKHDKILADIQCRPETIIDNLCTENCGTSYESE